MPESLSFYEDNYFEGRMSYDRSKLKLDLNSPSAISGSKRSLLSHVSNNSTPLSLQSPDMKMLKLASPELEKIILKNGYLLATPTPTDGGEQNNTDDPEQFTRGFVEALQKLHENDNTSFRQLYDQGPERKVKVKTTKDTSVRVSENQPIISTPYSNSYPVKTEDVKHPYSTTAPMSSASYSYVNNSEGYGDVGLNRNHVYTTSRSDTLAYPGSSLNSTSIAYPSGYTQVYTYDQANRGLALTVAEKSTSHRDVQSMAGKSTIPCASMVSGSTVLSAVDTSVTHLQSTTLPGPSHMALDEGAQIVPSSTPPIPIDLTEQEKIKHERKKLRNRLAAQRCRKRKIEREEDLRIKVKDLKTKHSELTTTASELRLQVCELKEKVMHHVNQGCRVFVPQGACE